MSNKGGITFRMSQLCASSNTSFSPGAVGVRLRLKETQEVLTFVAAHLAPHDYNVARRNMDWESIVTRMTFYSSRQQERYQLYDTDYLYVFGDLNYRTSKTEPRKLDKEHLATMLQQKTYSAILEHDQLRIESSAGRTLHSLVEADINFPPSYKYKKGSDQLVVSDEIALHLYLSRLMLASRHSRSECPAGATESCICPPRVKEYPSIHR